MKRYIRKYPICNQVVFAKQFFTCKDYESYDAQNDFYFYFFWFALDECVMLM